MSFHVRQLDAADVSGFRSLRLEALRLHPAAYGSSFAEELRDPPEDLQRRFLRPPAATFGGFSGDALVGIASLLMQTRCKTRHRADVFSVYVKAAHRHGGIGRALVEAAISHARDNGICVLHLTVTDGNDGARRMYEDLGFRQFALERRALMVDSVFHDTVHMTMDLDVG